jgi:hypothetical protein
MGQGIFYIKSAFFVLMLGIGLSCPGTLKSSVRVQVLGKVMLSTLPSKDMDSTIVTVAAPVNSLEASLILAA